MHSPNVGYVPRKVGLLGYLLELRWGPFRELSCYRSPRSALRISVPVLCLLCRIHGLSRPIQVPVLNFHLRCHVHHSLDCLLHVRFFRPRLPSSF